MKKTRIMPKKEEKNEAKKTTKQLVTKEMTIGDVVSKYPEAAFVMMKYGMHCIGCHVAAEESIENGCKAHGLEDKEIDELIYKINKLIEQKLTRSQKTS